LPREAGPRDRGERPLQARELAPAGQRALRLANPGLELVRALLGESSRQRPHAACGSEIEERGDDGRTKGARGTRACAITCWTGAVGSARAFDRLVARSGGELARGASTQRGRRINGGGRPRTALSGLR